MACSTSTRFVDVSDENSCLSEQGTAQNSQHRNVSLPISAKNAHGLRSRKKSSALNVVAPNLSRKQSLVESLSQNSVLTQKRLEGSYAALEANPPVQRTQNIQLQN